MIAPLADRIRPKTLDDVVGQQHILGPNKVLRRIIESGTIPNMVFYGPSGVGKTTVASIIAKQSHMHLCKLNGTTASTADIRDVVAQVNTLQAVNGVLLYLDEIQYFNKKQQQTLLEFIENGSITPTYIQYLWVRQQSDLSDKTVIYVPTETNLPILESTRMLFEQNGASSPSN